MRRTAPIAIVPVGECAESTSVRSGCGTRSQTTVQTAISRLWRLEECRDKKRTKNSAGRPAVSRTHLVHDLAMEVIQFGGDRSQTSPSRQSTDRDRNRQAGDGETQKFKYITEEQSAAVAEICTW